VPGTLNEILRHDFETGLVNLLNNADHASMGHSVESRLPFMDYRLVEFLASVPSAYKMRDGWTKYLARLAFDKKLPSSIVWRVDKKGWPIPEDKWFSGTLSHWLKECVISLSNRSGKFAMWISLDFPKDKQKMLRILNIEREIVTHKLKVLIK
jgi:asparagine synthase (glutamine-hydrolysing)